MHPDKPFPLSGLISLWVKYRGYSAWSPRQPPYELYSVSLSQRNGELLEDSGIKGVCLLTPVPPVGVGGVGHRHRHHGAANTLGNLVTQVAHRGGLASQ